MTARSRYHHGDLRTALVAAGVAAARTGGEAAVGLNRLAATVGVSPAAAYRHFPTGLDELLVAVGDVARHELGARIEERVGAVPTGTDTRETAMARFRASGHAYVDYVLAEPGLFQVACRHDQGRDPAADPFALLRSRITDLAAAGALRQGSDADVEDAALAAWASVHGLAVLLTEGPLRRLPRVRRQALVERTLDMVDDGLTLV